MARTGCLARAARFGASLCVVIVLLAIVALLLNARTPAGVGAQRTVDRMRQSSPPARAFTLGVAAINLRDRFDRLSPRDEEAVAAAQRAVALGADVISFEEVFRPKTRAALTTALRDAGLRYSVYFPSGLIGSGLLVASRTPIELNAFRRFKNGGDWRRPQEGDWYMGRGVAVVRIALPEAGTSCDLFSVELQSRYHDEDASFSPIGQEQIRETAEFVRDVRSSGPFLIVAGISSSVNDAEMLPNQTATRLLWTDFGAGVVALGSTDAAYDADVLEATSVTAGPRSAGYFLRWRVQPAVVAPPASTEATPAPTETSAQDSAAPAASSAPENGSA